MRTFKKIVKLFINITFFQKLTAYILLIAAFYFLRDFLFVLFLTFVFSYLFLALGRYLKDFFDEFLPKIMRNKKHASFLRQHITLNLIIWFLYVWFVTIVFFALWDLIPKLSKELKELPKYIPALSSYVDVVAAKLEEIKNFNSQIGWGISEVVSKQDMDLLIQVYEKVKTVGTVFFKVILSLILSYIFIIDREKLAKYLKGIESSNFGFLYYEYTKIIEKIVNTFGLVFKAQSMIAFVNAILTCAGLIIIGALHSSTFPFVYTLAIIVFICGFIPVIGTFISSLPILIIGYATFGNVTIVLEIILLIAFIHAVEAYYLNPKIVSSFIHLPVSLTFLVLILSEHLMWFAGLVIGISSFYLIIELLRDVDEIITNSKVTLDNMKEVEEETKEQIKANIRLSRKVDEKNTL